jgi:HD-GYP domain-containing protein (c-di-GMP phosphodiesterase class II)
MANLQALTHPLILDHEALHEFADALTDRAVDIERDMARLAREPANRVLMADIFRALHNIKGDASLCKVETANLIAHPIESLLSRLRSGEVAYTPLLGEVIMLAVDRLELTTEALLAGKPILHLKLIALVEGLERVSLASQADLDAAAAQVIEAVTGFQPQANLRTSIDKVSVQSVNKGKMAADLLFFRSLALQLETRSPLFNGRTGRIRQLVLETNQKAGFPVDAVQLEAAAYMHDVGMMFLPEAVWFKVGNMSDEERDLLHAHAGFAAGLLERMEGWHMAAQMVLQHHEKPDGAGYPAGLKADEICAGAKLLAIVDAFEAVMQKHNTRSHNRSVLRAVAEVNACDNQFALEWIEPFNSVIRHMVEQPA